MFAIAWLNQPYYPTPAQIPVSGRCSVPVALARLTGGELPPGMQWGPAGQPAGVPTVPGTYRYQVEYSDGCSRRAEWREIRVAPAPMLSVDPGELVLTTNFGGPAFAGGMLTVSGSVPGYPYSIQIVEAPWLQASPREGAIPEQGRAFESDTIRVRVNPAGLQPGNYTGRVRLYAWRGANAPKVTVRLRVDSVQQLLPARLDPIPAPPMTTSAAPSPSSMVPPAPPKPPAKPRAENKPVKPRPAPGRSKPAAPALAAPRSRVLPFPKVDVPKSKPKASEPPPPARTKPSAMPGAAAH